MSGRLRKMYGDWAVVTGASEGIGRAIAVRLAEAGFSLVLVARRKQLLLDLAAELGKSHGVPVRVIAADLTRPASVEAVTTAVRDLDVGLLVAAAGYGTSGAFVDAEIDDELAMIEVNCRAVASMAHVFARRFVARGRGGIVLMSSLVAFQGVPGAANYAATKAYIQSLAEGLEAELRPRGVHVLASAPGPVRSGFGRRAKMTMSRAQTVDEVATETLRALGRKVTVRPGLLAKALEAALMFLPRRGRVMVMSRVMAQMTGATR